MNRRAWIIVGVCAIPPVLLLCCGGPAIVGVVVMKNRDAPVQAGGVGDNVKPLGNQLQVFDKDDFAGHLGEFQVGWKGTFSRFKGHTMKVMQVVDGQTAIVMVGHVLFLQGAYRYHDPQTFALTNIDTSKMFDGQETLFHFKYEHSDVYHADRTGQINGRTYMMVKRIGTIKK